jgi:hypothetical protein
MVHIITGTHLRVAAFRRATRIGRSTEEEINSASSILDHLAEEGSMRAMPSVESIAALSVSNAETDLT